MAAILDLLCSVGGEASYTTREIHIRDDDAPASTVVLLPNECDAFLRDAPAVKIIAEQQRDGCMTFTLMTHNRHVLEELTLSGLGGRSAATTMKKSDAGILRDLIASLKGYSYCRGYEEAKDDPDALREMYDGKVVRRSAQCQFVVQEPTGDSRCSSCSGGGDERSKARAEPRTRAISLVNKKPRSKRKFVPCLVKDCGKKYGSQTLLRKHIKISHGEEKLTVQQDRPGKKSRDSRQCPVCDRSFSSASAARLHLVTHDDVKRFVCHCGKAFARPDQLRAHGTVHADTKDFLCTLCGKAFPRMASLNVHYRRRHRDDVPDSAKRPGPEQLYNCSACDKIFLSRQEAERHELRHTGAKPFSCDICSRSFTRKDKMKEHKRRVHEGVLRPQTRDPSEQHEDPNFETGQIIVVPENIVYRVEDAGGDKDSSQMLVLQPIVDGSSIA